MIINMRAVLGLTIWLGTLSLVAVALHLLDPRSFGQQGPLFVFSVFPGFLLLMIGRSMKLAPTLNQVSPAPRPVQLTKKAVFMIPGLGLIFMMALIPTVSAIGQATRHFQGRQEPLIDSGIIAVVIPLTIFAYALIILTKHRRLVRMGNWAKGIVTRSASRGGFAYQFSAADGEVYTGRGVAHVDILSAGSSLDIFYDPLAPRKSVASCGCYFEPWITTSQLPLRPATPAGSPWSPRKWKLAAGGVICGVLVFLLFDYIIYGRWYDTSGRATFHPTAGVLGRGQEEIVLQLPPGWRAYYNAHQPWRSGDLIGPDPQSWTLNLPLSHRAGTLLYSGAGPALGIIVALEDEAAGSPQALASYAQSSLTQLRDRGATISCEPKTKPGGEALLCLVSMTASEPGRAHVSHKYFERTQGKLLTITLLVHPSRADELAPVARQILESVQMR